MRGGIGLCEGTCVGGGESGRDLFTTPTVCEDSTTQQSHGKSLGYGESNSDSSFVLFRPMQ